MCGIWTNCAQVLHGISQVYSELNTQFCLWFTVSYTGKSQSEGRELIFQNPRKKLQIWEMHSLARSRLCLLFPAAEEINPIEQVVDISVYTQFSTQAGSRKVTIGADRF